MEIVSFEKRTFEEMAAKLDYFVQRMDDLCRQHGEKIGNRTYYRQEDVERVIVDVEERRKEAKWKGKSI